MVRSLWNYFFYYLCKKYHRSHHLAKLYSYIDEDIKSEIEERTYNKLKGIYQYKDYSFLIILEDIDNLFVEWRYIFKKNKKPGFFSNRINRYIPALSILLYVVTVIATNREKLVGTKKQ